MPRTPVPPRACVYIQRSYAPKPSLPMPSASDVGSDFVVFCWCQKNRCWSIERCKRSSQPRDSCDVFVFLRLQALLYVK